MHINPIENIGTNAGIVWRTLHNSERDLSLQELTQATGLDIIHVAAAIGWLARENKIVITPDADGAVFHVYKECYF